MGQNASDRLNIWYSDDGVTWNYPYTIVYNGNTPNNGEVRDPSIAKIGSTYWVVHTCQNGPTTVEQFCITSSADARTWSNLATISQSTTPAGRMIYAPEWVKNPNGTTYMDGTGCPWVAEAVTNGTTLFQIAVTRPTDCADFSKPWTNPVVLSISGESGQTFDPFIVCQSPSGGICTGSGDTFALWYPSITISVSQYIQYATSSTLTGTYTRQSAGGDWLNFGGVNQEGPMLIKLSDRWRLYYDRVPNPPGDIASGQIYYSDSFDNWATWSAPNATVTSIQAKHGTVIPYP